jgi:UDP-hydrolysing UDP-N-acetyl-D-glucosamine 2-epimerase
VRTVAVVTTSRADWSSCRPVARTLAADDEIRLLLFAGGSHLERDFGNTAELVEADGFTVDERVPCYAGTSTEEVARSVGLAASGFAAAYERAHPDLLLVVGDRLELLGVVAAAVPFLLPVAHVSGGDTTEGAIDDVVRHAVSKLSHLHFVAMPEHARRLEQLGEEPWRITVSGDPALDDVARTSMTRDDVARQLEVALEPPVVVVGVHPTTLNGGAATATADAVLSALEDLDATVVLTYPGADAGAAGVVERLESFAAGHPNASLHRSLGQDAYYALLANADVLVGNTSSGIWEAPSFGLPVVNVGPRQDARVRAANVVDAPAERDAVAAAIVRSLDPQFRRGLDGLVNPYGDGHAAERIVGVLRDVELGPRLLRKSL